MVHIDVAKGTQPIDLTSWPCSLNFAVLSKDILILEPDNQEKLACGKSKLSFTIDLLSGSFIEIEKGTTSLEDETIFAQVKPIMSATIEEIRASLLL